MAARQATPTVCVLGGTGFVGRSLSSLLVRRGYAVRIPTRNRQRNRRLLVLPGVDLRQANVHDEAELEELLRGCDAAINLVGILNEKGHDGSGFRAAHVDLVEKLIGACQETGVTRLIHMSALKANHNRGPSHYLRTKGQAERLIETLCGDEIHYTIFQPSVIFGSEDSFINRFAGLLRLSPILPLARLDARFAPVHVDDVALAFATALADSDTCGNTYELCGPDIYSLREIIDFVRRELGMRRLVVPMPGVLGRLQAAIADYLIPGKPFSLDNLRSMSVANVCSNGGLKQLGITPRPMHQIVRGYLKPEPDRLAILRRSNRRRD